MRLTHAYVVGSSGDPQAAAELSGHLADECADIIGESHLITLETRAQQRTGPPRPVTTRVPRDVMRPFWPTSPESSTTITG